MTIPPIIPALALIVLTGAVHAQQPTHRRETYNFNPGWLLKAADECGAEAASFADADWKKVTVPYAWNEDCAFKVSIDDLPTGVAWYRKHFKLPADAAGKKVFIEFEGIRRGLDHTDTQCRSRCQRHGRCQSRAGSPDV